MTTANPLESLGILLREHGPAVLASWQAYVKQQAPGSTRAGMARLPGQCETLLAALADALRPGIAADIAHSAWQEVRTLLDEIAAERARSGSTPVETATFIFSLKQSLFNLLNDAFGDEPVVLADLVWQACSLLDQLGLYSLDAFQRGRNQVIARQSHELLELSTPVIDLWEGVLALPLVGTLDSVRAQVVMESVLQKIADSGATVAIIDITGVPAVDTLVAQHLMRTIAAARLMGAECMICGISPQIAQTMVHLGVEFSGVTTRATLAEAFAVSLQRRAMRGAFLRTGLPVDATAMTHCIDMQ